MICAKAKFCTFKLPTGDFCRNPLNHSKISRLMKTQIIFSLSLCLGTVCFGQSDTIFFNNEKIVCSIKEITPDAVKYASGNEEVTSSIYKNAVQKIAYKNGKVQTFVEAASFKPVNSLYDYNDVTISRVEGEIHGLFKLGEVNSRAYGGTAFGNRKVRERAMRKLKILAAMEGANVVYLTNTHYNSYQYNQYGAYSASTNMLGVAYSNKVPDFTAFEKAVSQKTEFTAIQETKLSKNAANYTESAIRKPFKINKITNQYGLIMLDAKLDGLPDISTFRVVSLSDSRFNIFYQEKGKAYNVMVSL
jgi:hypothetical protein